MLPTPQCFSRYLFTPALLAVAVVSFSSNVRAGSLYFQGFENDASGWYQDPNGAGNGSVTATPSGGGPLGLTAADGSFYGTVHNNDSAYTQDYGNPPGYGTGGFSFFGASPSSMTPTSYPGSPFSQSIDVYIDPTTPAAPIAGVDAFEIDMSPDTLDPSDACYPAGCDDEHNFDLDYTGTNVLVNTDTGATLANITAAGWYQFEITYAQGATPTSDVINTLNVLNVATDTLLGTTTSQNNSLESQYLGGPGYAWLTVWQNGFSNDTLGIDDVRADTISSTPEPSTVVMIGFGLIALSFALRRRAVAGSAAK